MYESLAVPFMTVCSIVQFVYWLSWLYLLLTTDAELLDPMLDREYERLRRLLFVSAPAGTLFLQRLDFCIMAMWYRANRPLFAGNAPEDIVSTLGRFGVIVGGEGWRLARPARNGTGYI
jgi:hypothetical protein